MNKNILRTLSACGLAMTAALSSATAQARDGAFPLEIENCGRTLQFSGAPDKAVTIGQGFTEIMLRLGLEDRITGTSLWLAPLPADLKEQGSALPRLADNSPAFEAVLKVRPQIVLNEWSDDVNKSGGRVGSFEQFQDFGISTYTSPSECAKITPTSGDGDGARDTAWTVDLLERSISELAQIFDVEDAGDKLIADNRMRIATAAANAAELKAKNVSVLYWFSSPADVEGDAYVAGQLGAPGWISKVVGVHNVIESNEEWPLVGWETIVQLDPTVIVLATMERRRQPADDVEVRRHFLMTDPVASQLTAVRKGNLIEMDAQSMNPTLRSVDGVEVLAQGLRAHGLTE